MSCCSNIDRFINAKCAQFCMQCIFSFLTFTVGVLGIAGVFGDRIDSSNYLSLLLLVVGIWVKSPKITSTERPADDSER